MFKQYFKLKKSFLFSPYALALAVIFCFSLVYLIKVPTKTFVNESLKINGRAFTGEECTGYLGRDVTRGGYKAIQINLRNTTQRYLKLSQQDMDLKTVPAEIAAQSVYQSTTKRVLGWGIPSLFIPILLVPALITSTLSYKGNRKLLHTCKAKAWSDVIVAPNDYFTGVIFVPISDYKDSFSVFLTDQNTQEKIICGVKIA